MAAALAAVDLTHRRRDRRAERGDAARHRPARQHGAGLSRRARRRTSRSKWCRSSTWRRRRCRRAGRAASADGWRRAPPPATRRQPRRSSRWRPAAICCTSRSRFERRRDRSRAWSWRASICPGEFADRARRMSSAYEDYSAAAGVEAAARRRLRVVLRHGHAADSRRLNVDGAVPREANHAAGAVAVGGGARKSAPGITTIASSTKAPTNSASMVDAFNAMAAEVSHEPPRGSSGRPSISSASTKKARAAGATSRRSSNASPPAWSRSIAPAASARSTPRRCACSKSTPASSAVPRWTCSPGPTSRRSTTCSIRRRARKMDSFAQEVALVRDGRERHVVAAATRIAGADGASTARCWWSTTSRR